LKVKDVRNNATIKNSIYVRYNAYEAKQENQEWFTWKPKHPHIIPVKDSDLPQYYKDDAFKKYGIKD